MFLIITERVLSNKDLLPLDKLVLSLVLSYDHNHKTCFMSNQEIANALGVSARQVIRTIKKLELQNLIKVTYTESKGVYSNRTIEPYKVKKTIGEGSELQKLFDAVMLQIK